MNAPAPRPAGNPGPLDAARALFALYDAIDVEHFEKGLPTPGTLPLAPSAATRCEVCHNVAPLHDKYCPRQPGAFPTPRNT